MNETESQSIFISIRKRLSSKLRVNGRRTAWKSLVRYLGVVFDLSWGKQIQNARVKRSERSCNSSQLGAFKAVVRSQLICFPHLKCMPPSPRFKRIGKIYQTSPQKCAENFLVREKQKKHFIDCDKPSLATFKGLHSPIIDVESRQSFHLCPFNQNQTIVASVHFISWVKELTTENNLYVHLNLLSLQEVQSCFARLQMIIQEW